MYFLVNASPKPNQLQNLHMHRSHDVILSNILCDLDPKVKGQIYMHLLLNHWMLQLQTLQLHRSLDIGGDEQHFLWRQNQKMYFLVNASPP